MTIHVLGMLAVLAGFSWFALIVAVGLFWGRMFIITAFYHRYFSHRTFRTHRLTQFVFAFLGTTCAQRGPCWWAAHHREHHRHSDDEPDPHSPWWKGTVWSHTAWFLTEKGRTTNWEAVPDWKKYPELVWLEKYHLVGPLTLIVLLGSLGWGAQAWFPMLHTNPWQMVAWGFGLSTTLLYHATFTINSVAHRVGSQRFDTGDHSRNNWFLALITLGEGWHNNHHYCPGTVRQGFYWWEFDPAYWTLRLMSVLGLVWELNPVPARVYESVRANSAGRLKAPRPGGDS